MRETEWSVSSSLFFFLNCLVNKEEKEQNTKTSVVVERQWCVSACVWNASTYSKAGNYYGITDRPKVSSTIAQRDLWTPAERRGGALILSHPQPGLTFSENASWLKIIILIASKQWQHLCIKTLESNLLCSHHTGIKKRKKKKWKTRMVIWVWMEICRST